MGHTLLRGTLTHTHIHMNTQFYIGYFQSSCFIHPFCCPSVFFLPFAVLIALMFYHCFLSHSYCQIPDALSLNVWARTPIHKRILQTLIDILFSPWPSHASPPFPLSLHFSPNLYSSFPPSVHVSHLLTLPQSFSFPSCLANSSLTLIFLASVLVGLADCCGRIGQGHSRGIPIQPPSVQHGLSSTWPQSHLILTIKFCLSPALQSVKG